MTNIENILVFPYDIESCPIIRHSNLLNNFNISGVAVLKGWFPENADACAADLGYTSGYTMSSNFDELLNKCDTLFVPDYSTKCDFMGTIYPKVLLAVESNKNIICAKSISDEAISTISRKCETQGVYFKYFDKNEKKLYNMTLPGLSGLHEINTPIIFVAGLAERTHKFDIQLSLRDELLKAGYKVSQVGSRHYCELMGFHSFPSFMFSENIGEAKKITYFNSFIKSIETSEGPDVIIIGIPGGFMPFNRQFTNGFGIIPYEVSQAVTPDATIFSVLYHDYAQSYYKELALAIKYKLSLEVDCFNLANIQLDWVSSKLVNSLTYTTLDPAFISKKIRSLNYSETPVFNVLNTADSTAMSSFIINKLSDFSETQSI